MTWDLYEFLAALIHAPMLIPVAVAPALIWVQWAWGRRPKPGLAFQGLAISVLWSLGLAYLWRPTWQLQAAWGFWTPVVATSTGRWAGAFALLAMVWAWRRYRQGPSRVAHLRIQMVWAALWYFTLVQGGL